MYIIERIIEMLFIINETIFNSNFGIFFGCVYFNRLFGRGDCMQSLQFFFSSSPIISYIIFFRLECGQMIVHGTCLIYIFTTQCNNIEQSSEISK